jgi:DNA-binding transcriptional regulator YhcF (GntR family)
MAPKPADLDLRVDRGSDLPVGAQLATALRDVIETGALGFGERLPSVRALAQASGVNVNTARAVYGRLEHEGYVRSEHGRGTFVARAAAPGPAPERRDRAARDELRRQIARLERELVRRTARPSPTAQSGRSRGGRLATADELEEIRDRLFERLRELDEARAEVLRRLSSLEQLEHASVAPDSAPERTGRSTLSRRGARVRWLVA